MVTQLRFEFSKGAVRRVRLGIARIATTLAVEAPDALGVLFPGLARSDLLDTVAFPQAALVAEGLEATFGTHACSGEDENPLVGGDVNMLGWFSHRLYCGLGWRESVACWRDNCVPDMLTSCSPMGTSNSSRLSTPRRQTLLAE